MKKLILAMVVMVVIVMSAFIVGHEIGYKEGHSDGNIEAVCELLCYDIMGKIDSQELAEEYAEAVILHWENEGAFYTFEVITPEQYYYYKHICKEHGIVCVEPVCVKSS